MVLGILAMNDDKPVKTYHVFSYSLLGMVLVAYVFVMWRLVTGQ